MQISITIDSEDLKPLLAEVVAEYITGQAGKRKRNQSPSDKLTREETAALVEVSPKTLAKWASTGRHNLPYYRTGKRVFYLRSEVEEWMKRRRATRSSARQ